MGGLLISLQHYNYCHWVNEMILKTFEINHFVQERPILWMGTELTTLQKMHYTIQYWVNDVIQKSILSKSNQYKGWEFEMTICSIFWVNDLIRKTLETKHFVEEQPTPLIKLDIALFASSRDNFLEPK